MSYVYLQAVPKVRSNGIAIAGLVSGLIGMILTVTTGWIPVVGFFLILLPSVLAIIFGLAGKANARRGAPHASTASAGLTCGFVGLLLTILMQACWGALIGGVVMSVAECHPEVRVADGALQQEIQQRVEAEWVRMNLESPELEIQISGFETDPHLTIDTAELSTNPPADEATKSEGANSIDQKANPATEEAIEEAAVEPLII
jgi:hypothetical protein